uniref:Uncharacterized protein n=1 Tax=Neogobius melanostomus TaxID=47308 RepID=A0A8C6SJ16_9GOBI
MASALYAEELTCPVCLSIFTEPLTLPCGHSFCRGCITSVPEAKCPQCRAPCPPASELQLLPTSLILKSLAQRFSTKVQRLKSSYFLILLSQEPWLCPEHDERMKLFCVTDQSLICIICRDGEAHDGHRFKPIREAAAALRRDIDLGLVNITGQTEKIQKLVQTQSAEVKKAKELSAQLKSQVQQEFNSMHQFLRRREDQIINEMRIKEEDAVENMSQSLNAMKRALSECGELKESWTHIMEVLKQCPIVFLKVTDPEKFLRRWSEEHSAAAGDLFRERTEGLAVVQSPVFQGPYQSHLQFFMWKEMLQEVEPKAEALTLKDDNPSVTVSEDRRRYAPAVPESLSVSSSSTFSSGQHYWEVELRLRDFWCVGITDYFLKHEDQKYFVCEANSSTELFPGGRLLKLGVYLNCSSKTLTFYDADSMKRLHQIHCRGLSLPVSAYFCIRHKEPDTNPITVCRY